MAVAGFHYPTAEKWAKEMYFFRLERLLRHILSIRLIYRIEEENFDVVVEWNKNTIQQ